MQTPDEATPVPQTSTDVEGDPAAAIDGMSDEEAAALGAGAELEFTAPLQILNLAGASLVIQKHPTIPGECALRVGPILVEMIMPLSADMARQLARQLAGGIEIATGMPANLKRPG